MTYLFQPFLIFILSVVSLFPHSKNINEIETSDLKAQNLKISVDSIVDSWNNIEVYCVKQNDKTILCTAFPEDYDYPLFQLYTYRNVPGDSTLYDAFNQPFQSVLDNYYKIEHSGIMYCFDLQPTSYSKVDSLSIAWRRPKHEIFEYDTIIYGETGLLSNMGKQIDGDNCFEVFLPQFEFGDQYMVDNDSVHIEQTGGDWMRHQQNLPVLDSSLQNVIKAPNVTISYTLNGDYLAVKIEKEKNSLYFKLNVRNKKLIESCISSIKGTIVTYYKDGYIKRNELRISGTESDYKAYLKGLDMDDYIRSSTPVENIVMIRDYGEDHKLVRQEVSVNYGKPRYNSIWQEFHYSYP